MTIRSAIWRRLLPYIGGGGALLLFAAALLILHSHLQAFRPSEVRRALGSLQAWQPFTALGLAAASYLLLTFYDVLALRHIERRLPYRRVALASFIGYAFSHTLGFGSVIGPAVRYRLYTPLGLSTGEVAEASAFVIITFVTGIVAVFPLVVLWDPSSLEALGITGLAVIAIGMFAAILTAGYVGLGWWINRPLRVLGYLLDLVRPREAIAQIALSVGDLVLVAAVLFVCLPHASAVAYPHVLAIYVLAFVAGMISHVPGGLGVFDAVVLVGLSAHLSPDQILAGLLAFRVIYQLIPAIRRGRTVRHHGGRSGPAVLRADRGKHQWLARRGAAGGAGSLYLHWRRRAVVLKRYAGERRPPAFSRDGLPARHN